jgi:hypothetical protein
LRSTIVTTVFIIGLVLISISGCIEDDGNGGKYKYDGNTPVYVTLYSHNEDSWGPIVGTYEAYLSYRSNLVERLQIIKEYGAVINWQTDQVVIQAMVDYEPKVKKENPQAWAQTNNKNILRYMVEDMGNSVDPHAHKNSMADIAHLIQQLNVTPSKIIGGVRALDCGDSHRGFLDFVDWKKESDIGPDGIVRGKDFPQAEWKPNILTVAAMGGHWHDEMSSGVWRPGNNKDDFYTDQGPGNIILIGSGYTHDVTNNGPTNEASGATIFAENGAYIKELVDKITSGKVPSGKLYTASVSIRDLEQIRFDPGDDVNVNEGLRKYLGELKPLYDKGLIKYMLYDDVAQKWLQDFDGEPYRLDIESFSMYEDIKAQTKEFCGA